MIAVRNRNELYSAICNNAKFTFSNFELLNGHTLMLCFCEIGNVEAFNIANALENMDLNSFPLQYLILINNKIGYEGATAIIKALRSIDLNTLDFGNNNLGDIGAKAIAESLQNNSLRVQRLILNNNIGNEGIIAILSALQNAEFLPKCVDISANNITDYNKIVTLANDIMTDRDCHIFTSYMT